MTRVTITNIEDNAIITAKGHATGSTETCAAISCLLYALSSYLRTCSADFVEYFNEANVTINFRGHRDVYNFIKAAFLSLQEGRSEYMKVDIIEK